MSNSFTWDYEENRLKDFYGVYYGQAALPFPPDTLVYLTSPTTEGASVYNAETQGITGVYDLAKLTDGKSMDMYDVFLSGASAVLTVTNPNAAGEAKGRELILFRDSFGSSIAPLLLDCYETITLVDIRYIASGFLLSLIHISLVAPALPLPRSRTSAPYSLLHTRIATLMEPNRYPAAAVRQIFQISMSRFLRFPGSACRRFFWGLHPIIIHDNACVFKPRHVFSQNCRKPVKRLGEPPGVHARIVHNDLVRFGGVGRIQVF